MAQEKQTPEEREAELARREAALAAREAQLAQEQAELAGRKADFEEGKKSLLNNGDKKLCECERKDVRPFSADSAPDGYYHQGTVCTDRTVPCAGGDPYQLLRAVRRVSAFLFCSR